MPIFDKIITLCKQIATALLQDKEPMALNKSDMFNDEDKTYILKNLTEESLIKNRLNLSNQIDKKADWKKIKSKIKVPVYKLYWRYAAAAILVLALGYFFKDSIFTGNQQPTTNNQPVIVNNQIETGTDKATLTLEDGSQVALEKGTTYQTQNATSNGEDIVYNNSVNGTPRELVFNYLTVPRGGQFHIELSDGTEVWLNSETQLKYPVSFIDGQSRQVELVYGEAYFEVSHSTEHQGSDFQVLHDQQQVQVLGTEFNIKAYKGESHIYTTLADGSVKVTAEGDERILKPGEQSILNLQTNTLKIAEADVFRETAWKNGVFSFKGKSLKEIMVVLSRWYDMDVKFQNPDLERERFIGTLYKNQSIIDILESIKSTNIINTYEINGKTITLK